MRDLLIPGSQWEDDYGTVEIEKLDIRTEQVHFFRPRRKSYRVMEIKYFLNQFQPLPKFPPLQTTFVVP